MILSMINGQSDHCSDQCSSVDTEILNRPMLWISEIQHPDYSTAGWKMRQYPAVYNH